MDRLRSLPIPRSSVLAARVAADTAILRVQHRVTVAVAYAVGFRLHGSALDGLAAFGLVVVFGFAFEWRSSPWGCSPATRRRPRAWG